MIYPEALILDFDGVLADSDKAHTSARIKAFEEFGFDVNPELHDEAHRHGSHPSQIIGWILKQSGIVESSADVNQDATIQKVVDLKKQIFFDEISLGLDAIDYAVEFVDWAKQSFDVYGLAIATTAYRATEVRPYLVRHGLADYFNIIVAREDTPADSLKPHPFVYEQAAKLIRAHHPNPIEGIVAIEDSPRGLRSAKGANLDAIGITTTHSAEDLQQADKVLSGLKATQSFIVETWMAA